MPTIHRKTYSEMDVAFRRVDTPVTEAPEVHASQAPTHSLRYEVWTVRRATPSPFNRVSVIIRYLTIRRYGALVRPCLALATVFLLHSWHGRLNPYLSSPSARRHAHSIPSPLLQTHPHSHSLMIQLPMSPNSSQSISKVLDCGRGLRLVVYYTYPITRTCPHHWASRRIRVLLSEGPQNTPIRRSQTPSG